MPRLAVSVNDASDLDRLKRRADVYATASDALWNAINQDVQSRDAPDRFSHPMSVIAFRVEREASRAARIARAAPTLLERKTAEGAASESTESQPTDAEPDEVFNVERAPPRRISWRGR